MAGVLSALLIGYIGPVRGLLDQRAALAKEQAHLAQLERTRDAIQAQIDDLDQPAVLEARARALGLVAPGERPFVVRGSLDPKPVRPPAHDGGRLSWFTGIF